MAHDKSLTLAAERAERAGERLRSPFRRVSSLLGRNGSTRVGVSLLMLAVVFSIVVPWFTLDPLAPGNAILAPPSLIHPFGTDQFGRDLLSRSAAGCQISLLVCIASVVMGLLVALPIGMIAGYFGGRLIDEILMRIMDTLLSLPFYVLALFVLGVVGNKPVNLGPLVLPNSFKVMALIALAALPFFARVARAATLVEMQEDYVVALRVVGVKPRRILAREILVNVLPHVMVQAWLWMAIAVLGEAALSYLGLGIVPPQPTLGNLLYDATNYVLHGAWWFSVFPGLVITVVTLGLNLLGDGLAEER